MLYGQLCLKVTGCHCHSISLGSLGYEVTLTMDRIYIAVVQSSLQGTEHIYTTVVQSHVCYNNHPHSI